MVAVIHRELGIPEDYETRFRLRLHGEARELVTVSAGTHGRVQQIGINVAEPWRTMHAQARADGVTLLLVSAFRTVEYQRTLIARKLEAGRRLEDILKVNAAPGYSEHHTGCALDLGVPDDAPLETSFETTKAFAWLMAHAGRFGFRMSYPRGNAYGIAYEPWHWACLKC